MSRLFGIETEYGIVVEGLSANEWIRESMAVVRNHTGKSVGGWNYRSEDPRKDMRGFTVQHLSMNPDDAKFDAPGAPRLSREEERSDRVLENGARFYNDHGHPEYATPECRSLRDLVAHDRAGEKIVYEAAQSRASEIGKKVSIYKNNTDFHGSSYGMHESYLTRRDIPVEKLIAGLLPFLTTRQIYAGAGKVGIENETGSPKAVYQLSQRADFFSVEASVDTLHNRPIVNTRDEPHSAPSKYRRLHVICGDANMSEYATALKVGTTSLLLSLIEEDALPEVRLAHPVQAVKQISRDISLRKVVELEDGGTITAIDLQEILFDAARTRFSGLDEDSDWTLSAWGSTLISLRKDPISLSDRLDWVSKYKLLNAFREEEGLEWSDDYLQSLDLAYHDLNPDEGLYQGLEQAGEMRRLFTETRIEAAIACPPANTRAYIRGLFVQRFGSSIRSIGWNGIAFSYQGEDFQFDMNTLVEENVELLNEELSAAVNLDDIVSMLKKNPSEGAN